MACRVNTPTCTSAYLGRNFHAPPEVPDDDETAFLLSQDKLGQGLLGTRRVNVPFVFVILKFFIVILLQIILHDKGPYESQARPWVGGCHHGILSDMVGFII